MTQQPTVVDLNTYPIKSCAKISTETVDLEATGFLHDRRWMVAIREQAGKPLEYVSLREEPRLALVQPRFADYGDTLILTAPGMSEVRIAVEERPADRGEWLDVMLRSDCYQGLDEGREVAAWLSDYLKAEAHLLRMPNDYVRQVNPAYSPEPARTAFSDGYPVLLISRADLRAVNDRLAEQGKPAVTMERFRPNLVIDGAEAFAEDYWKRIRVGDIIFDVVKPCPRCVMTTVEPTRGEFSTGLLKGEPLATLSKFRRTAEGKVMFGQNLVHRGMGTIRLGDSVEILN